MNRVTLSDGSGRWFDKDVATSWDEDTEWDGNNHISMATGSQWEHERLWRTAGGVYILRHWSQWQGSLPSWSVLDKGEAAIWLVENGHECDLEAEGNCKELAAEIRALQVN